MQIERHEQIESSPRLTPLIDVVLLLLIFFLLTSNFIDRSAIPVNLPEAETGEQPVRDSQMIAVTPDDQLKWNGDSVTLDTLKNKIKNNADKTISLYADRHASFGILVDVWDLLRQHNVHRFHIEVRQREDALDRDGD